MLGIHGTEDLGGHSEGLQMLEEELSEQMALAIQSIF